MTDLKSLKDRAESIDAEVTCPDDTCDYSESFSRYLDREDRVDEADKSVTWKCPTCGSDTLRLGRRRNGKFLPVMVVNGIEEMEQAFGE